MNTKMVKWKKIVELYMDYYGEAIIVVTAIILVLAYYYFPIDFL